MRLVFAGTPEVAVPSLRALAAGRHEITSVVTRPDAPLGRRRVMTPSPVAAAAAELGIPVHRSARLDAGVTTSIAEEAPDLGVIVAYGGLARGLAALAVASGKAPRLLGWAVFLLYAEWMVIAMSYGKVDHDRIAFLVALAVLPTIGRARWKDRRSSEAAGFGAAAVLVTVMLTYFLAAWAKMRFGGWDWATGSTLTRAVLRRGTDLSLWTLDVAWLLPTAQWLMLAFEFASPLMLLVRSDRARAALVLFLLGFHVMVYAGVGIIFLPHCIAILSILPWERLRGARAGLAARRTPATAGAADGNGATGPPDRTG